MKFCIECQSEKQSREVNPVLKAFVELKGHIGTVLKDKGIASAKVASKYISKVPGKDGMDKIKCYKEAKKIFDEDSDANKKKAHENAIREIKEKRAEKKANK